MVSDEVTHMEARAQRMENVEVRILQSWRTVCQGPARPKASAEENVVLRITQNVSSWCGIFLYFCLFDFLCGMVCVVCRETSGR